VLNGVAVLTCGFPSRELCLGQFAELVSAIMQIRRFPLRRLRNPDRTRFARRKTRSGGRVKSFFSGVLGRRSSNFAPFLEGTNILSTWGVSVACICSRSAMGFVRQSALPNRFRKASCSRFYSQPPATQRFGKSSRTCFEGPFGEVIRATGPMAKANPFRFSTKYQDDETDLLYYGYRYYNASTGRWTSRDPAQEDGGENLYGFVSDDPVNGRDPFGLAELEYWSRGKVEYDGPGEYTWGITWQVDRDYAESGVRSSPSAFIYQTVIVNHGCEHGVCNSTVSDSAASEVRAKGKNVSKCPLLVECDCNIHWLVSNSTPSRQGARGSTVYLTVLGYSDTKFYRPLRQPDGSYLSKGIGTFQKKKQFRLAPGAVQDLYYGYPYLTSPGLPGAGFQESMSGDCSCTVLN